MAFGNDDQFYKLATDKDSPDKVPAKFPLVTLAGMKKDAKDHHYVLGMRGLPSDLKAQEKENYERRAKDLMQNRPQFMQDAKATQNRIRKSNFKLAQADFESKKNHFGGRGSNYTPRLTHGDTHFHRTKGPIAINVDHEYIKAKNKLESTKHLYDQAPF